MLVNMPLELKQHFSSEYAKVSLLTSYNLINNFDIICVSEKFLNSETAPNNSNLETPGYNIYLADYPSN